MKVICYIPMAGYRPYPQMMEAYQNAKNFLFKRRNDIEFREYFCPVFPIHSNRNACVGHSIEGFVDGEERWFPDTTIWIDADTVIPYDGLFRLLDHPELKVLSGWYKKKTEPHYPMVFLRNFHDMEDDIWLYQPITNFVMENWDTPLMHADMVGQGCVRIDVDVLKAIDPPHFQYPLPSKYEQSVYEGVHPGLEFCRKWHVYTNTEESTFWRKVVDKGFDIFVDPKIKCKHMREDAVE